MLGSFEERELSLLEQYRNLGYSRIIDPELPRAQMKRFALFFFLFLLSLPAFGRNYVTAFNSPPAPENPISEAGNWINGGTTGVSWGNVQTTSGFAFGTIVNSYSRYNDNTAVVAGTWGPNQTVQAVVQISGTDNSSQEEVELRLNTTITANSITGYELDFSILAGNPYLDIVRWDGPLNSFCYINSGATCSSPNPLPFAIHNGDVLTGTNVGGTITIYVNGVAEMTAVDNTYTGGSPGMGFWNIGGTTADLANYGFSSFTATDADQASTSDSVNVKTVVHYIGAGSSAMFQGFGIAAYNDLGLNSVCAAGAIAIATPGSGSIVGDACTVSHWSVKAASDIAALKDSRSTSIPLEYGNLWVVWVTDTTTGSDTDAWAYLAVDSTVGVRNYLAVPRAQLFVLNSATSTAGANAIAENFFADNSHDNAIGLPDDVWMAISGVVGTTITAGMTDIRPEDAKLATERILGSVPSPYGGDTVPTTADNFIYSFSLGYGPGPVGLQIKSAEPGSTAAATPVEFSLPGGTDPISGSTVSSTINVYPVGESPIVFVANRTNTSSGLGQVIPSQSDCTTLAPDCLSSAYTSDGSYQYRNVWDQHPWPDVANTFPNLNEPSAGYCAVSGNQSTAACHVTRRPLGNLFSGGDCETDSSAFTWPLDANTEGLRVLPPNGAAEPITLFLREPLSGTYNTTEYTEIRRYGTPGGSLGTNGSGTYERAPYISQETNVVIGQPGTDPLDLQCPAKFGGETGTGGEGFRVRGIGTGEVTNGPGGTSSGDGVLNTPDSIAYTFFSFGNVSKLGKSVKYGYLMIDGVDPLFSDYSNSVSNPGQPATPGSPLTWGELPVCGGAGQPVCTATAIWGSNPSYPHLRDGSYPAWSELRMLCDPSEASPHCTLANDPIGAEALVQNLQADIHFSHTGGVPDFLPLADGGLATFGTANYGDAAYVRQHYVLYGPDDQDFANGAFPWQTTSPSSTHLGGSSALTGTGTQTYIDYSSEVCSVGHVSPGTPANGPAPTNECGGDAGGFIVPVASSGMAATGNLQ